MAKTLISIRIDADVLAWFREKYAATGYQSAINDVLRAHVGKATTDDTFEVYSANRITLDDLRKLIREELDSTTATKKDE